MVSWFSLVWARAVLFQSSGEHTGSEYSRWRAEFFGVWVAWRYQIWGSESFPVQLGRWSYMLMFSNPTRMLLHLWRVEPCRILWLVLFDKDGAKDLSLKDMDQSRKGVPASWPDYPQHLTQLDGKVSRYNADLTGEDCHLFAEGQRKTHGNLRKPPDDFRFPTWP